LLHHFIDSLTHQRIGTLTQSITRKQILRSAFGETQDRPAPSSPHLAPRISHLAPHHHFFFPK
jgi:hypothetical protein